MRKILIAIDMQNDFIDGSLGTKEALAIVPAVLAKLSEYEPEDIFATRDTHSENYMESQEGKNLPVPLNDTPFSAGHSPLRELFVSLQQLAV